MTDELIYREAALQLIETAKPFYIGELPTIDQETAYRAIAALPAAPVGVTVKPLGWFEVEKYRYGGKYTSEGYTIRYVEGFFMLDFAGSGKTEWRLPTIEAAKAAAQADYTARILAALEPPTHADLLAAALALPEMAALVDAGKLIRKRCGPIAPDGKKWDAALAALEARHD